MASLEELVNAMTQLQAQVQQAQAENSVLRERMATYEAANVATANGGGLEARDVLQALRGLPEALAKMSKPKGLFDPKGLGKPQTLGEDAENRFRLWAVKLEDYVYGVYGGKSREVLEWAAALDTEIGDKEISDNYGASADLLDQWDEVYDFNNQLYSVLRATTEGIPFDVVENVATGAGLDAWRSLHKRFDPATGSRKRVMLHALTNPERASYETLQSALERWKALKLRYDKKKDQFGAREPLPESLAMNSLEKLVPKELEQHLLLNYARFKTFEEMELEVVNFIEAKTGNRLNISTNFAKASGGSSSATPMDVDSLVRVVQGSISSLAQTKGGGKNKSGGSNKINPRFEGTCNNCGKPGHKQHDCWAKPASGGKVNMLHRGRRVQVQRRRSSSPASATIVGRLDTRDRSVGPLAVVEKGRVPEKAKIKSQRQLRRWKVTLNLNQHRPADWNYALWRWRHSPWSTLKKNEAARGREHL